MFLGYDGAHPVTYEMLLLLEETAGVIPRLRAQEHHQPNLPTAFLRLIQQEFNKSFHQALVRRQRVRCPTLRASEGLLQLEISGRSWSPSQEGWHLQNALYYHPQQHTAWQQHPRQQATPPRPRRR